MPISSDAICPIKSGSPPFNRPLPRLTPKTVRTVFVRRPLRLFPSTGPDPIRFEQAGGGRPVPAVEHLDERMLLRQRRQSGLQAEQAAQFAAIGHAPIALAETLFAIHDCDEIQASCQASVNSARLALRHQSRRQIRVRSHDGSNGRPNSPVR